MLFALTPEDDYNWKNVLEIEEQQPYKTSFYNLDAT